MKSKLKIAGLMVFVLVFTLTMTACDSAMDTGSDVTEEVEETGELLVEADLPELSQLESEVETSDVSAQSTVEERFSDYEIIVRLEHNSSGRVHEETDETDSNDDVSALKTKFGFGNVLAGEWTLIVELKADYIDDEDQNENIIASAERNVTVEAGKSNKLEDVKVTMNDGELDIDVQIPDDAVSGEMILKDADNTVEKIELSNLSKNEENFKWSDLAPARAYTAELRFWDDESQNNLITEAEGVRIHVLPGTIKNIIAKYHSGRESFNFGLELPPSMPTDAVAEVNNGDIEVTWNYDGDTPDKFVILRREPMGSDNPTVIDTIDYNDANNSSDYSYTDENVDTEILYQYQVEAKSGDLISDSSDPSDSPVGINIEYVTSSGELDTALDDDNISTIIVAEGTTIEDNVEIGREDVTLKAENENATIEGDIFIGTEGDGASNPTSADGTVIDGFEIVEPGLEGEGRGIGVTESVDVVIQNNEFEGFRTQISLEYSGDDVEDITIQGNTFSDVNEDDGTAVGSTENVDGLDILNNVFTNNRNDIGLADSTTDVTIEGNDFEAGDSGSYITNRIEDELDSDVILDTNDFDPTAVIYEDWEDGDWIAPDTALNVINTTQNTGFDDLQSALDAAKVGDTIKLNNDIEYAAPNEDANFEITQNDLTLDGNGNTLKYADIGGGRSVIKATGNDITVRNLTLANQTSDKQPSDLNAIGERVLFENNTIIRGTEQGNPAIVIGPEATGTNVLENDIDYGAIVADTSDCTIQSNTMDWVISEGIWMHPTSYTADKAKERANELADDNTITEYDATGPVKVQDKDDNWQFATE